MAKEDKKVARQRFDEIMGVAKRHHLASLLKENKELEAVTPETEETTTEVAEENKKGKRRKNSCKIPEKVV